jgi:hypothetical protein
MCQKNNGDEFQLTSREGWVALDVVDAEYLWAKQ